jgi:hypothetical protein
MFSNIFCTNIENILPTATKSFNKVATTLAALNKTPAALQSLLTKQS